MKTHIVIISVDKNSARSICEEIENKNYSNYEALYDELKEKINDISQFDVYTISEFMDMVNNQILDVLSEYFISYVQINK